MKSVLIFAALTLTSFSAVAEGPILECQLTRSGPRADGRLGFEVVDQAKITTVVGPRLRTTEINGATAKTYIDTSGNYVLVLIDKALRISSNSSGTFGNQNINLSLDGGGFSNFISCEVL